MMIKGTRNKNTTTMGSISVDCIAPLCWYHLYGVCHEFFHLMAAFLTGILDMQNAAIPLGSILSDIFLWRQLTIPYEPANEKRFDWRLFIVQNIGWVSSAILAVYVHSKERNAFAPRILRILPAYLTAFDAIATDLLGIQQLSFLSGSFATTMHQKMETRQNTVTLYCGNFGVLLLHSAWFGDGGRSAFNILEKMIQVTMMRGAQTGGVVTFHGKTIQEPSGDGDCGTYQMIGTRTRVVKSKRGDLSKNLRSKIEKEASSFFNLCKGAIRGAEEAGMVSSIINRVKFFAGHTRFATTSKATFDGTHPHQWTNPKTYRVYNMEEMILNENVGGSWSGRSFVQDLSTRLRRVRVGRRRGITTMASPSWTRVENFISHNGDFEFYTLNDTTYDLENVQKWLEKATETKMPSVVDSAAIAGMVDIIRCKGCFGLSVRYVVCLGLPTSRIPENTDNITLPTSRDYEAVGMIFEKALRQYQNQNPHSLDVLGSDLTHRECLARKTCESLIHESNYHTIECLNFHVGNEEQGTSYYNFAAAVFDAFFDNDLLQTVNIFMKNASGSFGLCVMSSLDSHRQICFAARGQTMSVAFYPQQHIILWGSEQAAVKAGIGVEFSGNPFEHLDRSILNVRSDVLRLDLDDLGGEICLLDWGRSHYSTPAISKPNRGKETHSVMDGDVDVYLLQEAMNTAKSDLLYHRMTKLTKNDLITRLPEDSKDPIKKDICDIPGVCALIQDDWGNRKGASDLFSLNRLTAWNLGRSLKERLEQYATGALKPCPNRVDILLTGCEVSLWLAEQFASDLQKAFPRLRIAALSSNKLLGLYGQDEINIPPVGFGISDKSLVLFDAITVIVSHSGGTFAPLNCSSLFQGKTKNIFVVTSEWDTQIGKQLRLMDNDGLSMGLLFNSRIFTTGIGMRPAEPCSISVAATHQLLTNIFEFMAIFVLSDYRYRNITGAVITQSDLQILERCNRDNLQALQDIVEDTAEKELRSSGDIWAEHILENVKAYIMTFVYIMGTVISGYPIATGIALGAGLSRSHRIVYVLRFIDALIYFFLPQINVIILRIIQRRPLIHRMVGRTVVIGDIPWVAQAAEAFLSKIFACSYSIAGLNVHSANPSDHLVHRMTHRVVRGSLLICGRPDGRLSALTAMESAISLSINQASSIQSLGSTCESVTIGHNPFKLPLTARAIFLKRFRPFFLCEHLIKEDDTDINASLDVSSLGSSQRYRRRMEESSIRVTNVRSNTSADNNNTLLEQSINGLRTIQKKGSQNHSTAALLSKYKSLQSLHSLEHVDYDHFMDNSGRFPTQKVLEMAIHEKKWSDSALRLFNTLDADSDAMLSLDEFVSGMRELNRNRSEVDLTTLFRQFDTNNVGKLSFDQFFKLMTLNPVQMEKSLEPSIRDNHGVVQVEASKEQFFGEIWTRRGVSLPLGALKSQNFAQELYESRIASLQRFVAMTVMFHQMGWRVENFFSKMSFGQLGYRMDRTHSIMRIATTASPVSGADVRDRKWVIFYMRKMHRSVDIISTAWLSYKARKNRQVIAIE